MLGLVCRGHVRMAFSVCGSTQPLGVLRVEDMLVVQGKLLNLSFFLIQVILSVVHVSVIRPTHCLPLLCGGSALNNVRADLSFL